MKKENGYLGWKRDGRVDHEDPLAAFLFALTLSFECCVSGVSLSYQLKVKTIYVPSILFPF